MKQPTPIEDCEQEDKDLALRAPHDGLAFALLYERYYPLLHKYAYYRTGDAQTADDLTALIFEKALKSLPRYQPNKNTFRAWLFGIARHTLADHHRAEKRDLPLQDQIPHSLAANDPQPEERLLQSESGQALHAALTQLNPRDKDLLALKFAGGLTNREIARVSKLTETHVGVLLYRALKQLRQILTPMEETHENE